MPDEVYIKEISRLNGYSNVRTIGYVPINYGRRPVRDAYTDIDKYSSWGTQDVNLAMQGIFLDESPQIADNHNTTYVENIRLYLKSQRALSNGLLGMCMILSKTKALTYRSNESWNDTGRSNSPTGRPHCSL